MCSILDLQGIQYQINDVLVTIPNSCHFLHLQIHFLLQNQVMVNLITQNFDFLYDFGTTESDSRVAVIYNSEGGDLYLTNFMCHHSSNQYCLSNEGTAYLGVCCVF